MVLWTKSKLFHLRDALLLKLAIINRREASLLSVNGLKAAEPAVALTPKKKAVCSLVS
jgi:hypothetical protein